MMERGFQIALLASLLLLPRTASSQDGTGRTFSSGFRFVEMSGEELFANVCQGCHMPTATGATGAGAYPSLASDPNLESSAYGIDIVVNGRRAMPPFGDMMNDAQVAAVVNYLRTHFGNDYRDAALPKDVSVARR
jgi:mono/diheme cytochrome c family protein